MLRPTDKPLVAFIDSFDPPTPYQLRDVQLEIPDESTAVFRATLVGPKDAAVWARAWISNEADGTLAEGESSQLTAGDQVTLTVKLTQDKTPELACMRIESEPLATKHTVHLPLP